MAKKGRITIELRSTETHHVRMARKNPKSENTAGKKLEFKKFDPIARKHVIYKEGKVRK